MTLPLDYSDTGPNHALKLEDATISAYLGRKLVLELVIPEMERKCAFVTSILVVHLLYVRGLAKLGQEVVPTLEGVIDNV